jgi:predicted ATP-grasp superfamily ATP-dependent carboligase
MTMSDLKEKARAYALKRKEAKQLKQAEWVRIENGYIAGYKAALADAAAVCRGFDCCHPQHRILVAHIEALGGGE